jgi:hypothetical protein
LTCGYENQSFQDKDLFTCPKGISSKRDYLHFADQPVYQRGVPFYIGATLGVIQQLGQGYFGNKAIFESGLHQSATDIVFLLEQKDADIGV